MNNLTNLAEGVKIGARIEADHILKIVNALSGVTENDIVIKGALNVDGNLSVTGTGSINNLEVNNGAHISYVKVDGQGSFNSVSATGSNSTFYSTQIISGIQVSGSVILSNLPLLDSTRFVSYNPETGMLGYSSGSLREKITPVDIAFQFTEKDLDQQHSFKGLIQDISFYKTNPIDSLNFSSRVDGSPTWINHKDINELQHWVNVNIMGDRLSGTIFWIRVVVKYPAFIDGKSEVVIRYTTT